MLNIENLVPPAEAVRRFPKIFTNTSIKYYMRPDVKHASGFDRCIVEMSPRKRLINLDEIPAWIEEQAEKAKRGAA